MKRDHRRRGRAFYLSVYFAERAVAFGRPVLVGALGLAWLAFGSQLSGGTCASRW